MARCTSAMVASSKRKTLRWASAGAATSTTIIAANAEMRAARRRIRRHERAMAFPFSRDGTRDATPSARGRRTGPDSALGGKADLPQTFESDVDDPQPK